MGKSLFVHIVTYNHKPYIEKCIHSVLNQEGYLLNENLLLYVTDNNSYDGTAELVSDLFPEVDLTVNEANIGFAAAHNQGFYNFCRSGYEFILVLNPDVVLKRDFLAKFVGAADKNKEFGLYTPKLLRAEESLEPVIPHVFDAAGMVLTHTLRHFDRGSGERDLGQYEESEEVFGGTGACLLIRRECLVDLELRGEKRDRDLYKVYPFLSKGREKRLQVFDEAFFAYREDAELCWRANLLGWRCLYVPEAVAYHRRRVLPSNRRELPPEYNIYSVRNRFLMQAVNFSFKEGVLSFLFGVIIRNIIVICGVLVLERSSFKGILDAIKLLPRALERRRKLFNRLSGANG